MAAVAPSTLPRPRPQPQPRPQRPDLRVVVPVRRRRRYAALLMVVAALGVFGVLTLNALAAESAFQAQRLEREVADLAVRYDELTAEVAALESPDRVQRIATEQLGMVPAEEPGYLVVEHRPGTEDVALRDDPAVPTLSIR